MRILKSAVSLAIGLVGLVISARALNSELSLWALLLLFCASLLVLITLLRPLFVRRSRGKQKSSGLPSKYERVQDPWRALSAGQDPTKE